MRAVVMRAFGGADVLRLEDVPDPQPGPGEALVRVGAVEVARTRDAATRSGKHPFSRQVSLPHVLGGEFAGVVEAVGAGVDAALVGRRVAASNAIACGACHQCSAGHEEACPTLEIVGINRRGSYAELVALPAANLRGIPDDIAYEEAAAMAANGAVAFAQLAAGDVGPGSRVVICGAAGALGSTLVALAAARGADVIALSRRDPELLERWGARTVLDTNADDLGETLLALTDGAGVDAVIDNVALPGPFERYLPALAIRGRVVMSGAISLERIAFAPLPFYLRSQSIIGVRTGNAASSAGFWDEVDQGFRLPEDLMEVLPLDEARRAHERVESGQKVGHVVLSNVLRPTPGTTNGAS